MAVGIVAFALEQRIEDSEVRLRIHPSRGAEAPPAVIGREVAVDEVLHEIALAHAPIKQQVFGQERCYRHAGAIVHITCMVHLAHGGVDKGVAGAAVAPCFKITARVFPGYVGVLGFEGFIHA